MASDTRSTVFFVGGGNMAYAIIGGLDRKKWRVIVDEIYEPQRLRLEKDLGVETVSSCSSDSINVCSTSFHQFQSFPLYY